MDKSDLTPEQLIKFEMVRDNCKEIMRKDIYVIRHSNKDGSSQVMDEEDLNEYVESFMFRTYKDFSNISISDVEKIYLKIHKTNAVYQVMTSLYFKKPIDAITGDEEIPDEIVDAFFEKSKSDLVINSFSSEFARSQIKIIKLCRKIDDLEKENQALKYNQRVGGVNGA